MQQPAVFSFFAKSPEGLPVYEAVAQALHVIDPEITLQVQKTQLTFRKRYTVACLWLPPHNWRQGHPAALALTLGFPSRLDSPRVKHAVEVRPQRWTHHILLFCPEDVDEEISSWLFAAYAFSMRK